MLFRLDDVEGQPLFGGVPSASDGRDFEPGESFAGVRLWFWMDTEALAAIEPGARFVVWYGGDIGDGVVRSC